MIFDLLDVLNSLQERGWIPHGIKGINHLTSAMGDAIRAFQGYHALGITGQVDEATLKLLTAPRMCGLPDCEQLNSDAEQQQQQRICKWPDGNIPWCVVAPVQGMTKEQTEAEFEWAISRWAAHSGIKPVKVNAPQQARIFLVSDNIDGRGKVLGDAQLPCGGISSSRIRADRSESWMGGRTPVAGRILASMFLLHEIGHSLGIPHIAPALGTAVLNPTYNDRINDLQPLDIQEIQRRYGKTPNPQPIPEPTHEIQMIVSGKTVTVRGDAAMVIIPRSVQVKYHD